MKRALNEMERRNDEAAADEIRGMTDEEARVCALRMTKGYADLMRACEDLLDRIDIEAGDEAWLAGSALRAFEAEVGYQA